MKTNRSINSNQVIGCLTVIFGAAVLFECVRIYQYARSFLTGDHIIPGTAGGILVLLGLNLIFFTPAPTFQPTFPKGLVRKRILGTTALMVAYLLLIQWVGYVVSTLLASYGLFRVFGKYTRVKSVVMAMLTTFFVWVVFIAWLHMPFPRGIFKYVSLPF